MQENVAVLGAYVEALNRVGHGLPQPLGPRDHELDQIQQRAALDMLTTVPLAIQEIQLASNYFGASFSAQAQAIADAIEERLQRIVDERIAGLEDRIIRQVVAALGAEDVPERDDPAPEEVAEAVREYFSKHHGEAFDAEDVARALGYPIWSIIDAMDALSECGVVRLAEEA